MFVFEATARDREGASFGDIIFGDGVLVVKGTTDDKVQKRAAFFTEKSECIEEGDALGVRKVARIISFLDECLNERTGIHEALGGREA